MGTAFVADVVEEFLRSKLPREPKTYAAYSSVLKGSEHGTKPALGLPLSAFFYNRRFNTVTHDEVTVWFAQRVRGGAQATKHRVSKSARAFFRFAKERGYTDPDLGTAIHPFRAGGPRVDWLEWNEIHTLIAAIPEDRYKFAAAWLFYSGCRIGEACAAQQQDVRWRPDPGESDTGVYVWTIPDSKTHQPRSVWLPGALNTYIETSRAVNKPDPSWPLLWDCAGHGYARVESPAEPISPRTINSALDRARSATQLPVRVTAHIARHSYCTNWIKEQGANELAMEKLSRQVGTSVGNLRKTYVHHDLQDADWAHIKNFGAA